MNRWGREAEVALEAALARAEAAEIALHEELVESVGYLHRARSAEAVIEQVRAAAVHLYLHTAREELRDILDLLPEVTP